MGRKARSRRRSSKRGDWSSTLTQACQRKHVTSTNRTMQLLQVWKWVFRRDRWKSHGKLLDVGPTANAYNPNFIAFHKIRIGCPHVKAWQYLLHLGISSALLQKLLYRISEEVLQTYFSNLDILIKAINRHPVCKDSHCCCHLWIPKGLIAPATSFF